MVHYAKVDWWLAALFGGAALAEVVAAIAVVAGGLIRGEPELLAILGTAALLAGVGVLMGLILSACYKTRYEITASELIIRFGPFHSALRLDAIVEVFPTHNPLSAPAPSLDRLRINYRRKQGGRWFALISPRDKEAFVRDLVAAAPQLRSDGDAAARIKGESPT